LIGPTTFRFKLFMLDVYKATAWDEKLPAKLTEPRKALIADNEFVPSNIYKRYALVDYHSSIQLHGFSDAFLVGYVAAIYIRSENDFGSNSSFVFKVGFSKSKNGKNPSNFSFVLRRLFAFVLFAVDF